jgi:hypothetical protein
MNSREDERDEFNDEENGAEESAGPEERVIFPFKIEDSFLVDELKKVVRKILRHPTLSGNDMRRIGTVLFALERLPRSTPGAAVGLSVVYRYNNESTYCELFISESELRLTSGGNTYDPAVGSDSYSQSILEMETSGFKDGCTDSYEVTGWFNSVSELLNMESRIEIEYLGDDGEVDWSDEGSEDFWEDIEEE